MLHRTYLIIFPLALQTITDRTGQSTDRQRSDSMGRTVLQTVDLDIGSPGSYVIKHLQWPSETVAAVAAEDALPLMVSIVV